MVHDTSGATALHPYGQREHEVIYSVGRGALNRVLIEEAARHDNVEMLFEQTCIAAIPEQNVLRFHNRKDRTEYDEPLSPTIATDGAGSAVRTSLARTQQVTVTEDWLDHDYKELTIPAVAGRHVLDANSLHIWPRGGFMLIALPNTDGSFTATLFLARTGQNSFAALKDDGRRGRILQARVRRRRPTDAEPAAGICSPPPRATGHGAPGSMAHRRQCPPARRRRPRHRPFPWAGHERRVRGLHRSRRAVGPVTTSGKRCSRSSRAHAARTPRPSQKWPSKTTRKCATRC